MKIIKRVSIPQGQTSATAGFDEDSDGRSPDLQGQRYEVWQFIQNNPQCTREDVSRGLGLKSSTATARIKELIDLGYVTEPFGLRKENRSGVKARVLVLTERKAGGKANDRVTVEVKLTIDCNGVYGAYASVVNGDRQRGPITVLATRVLTLTAPPAASYAAAFDTADVAPISRLDLQTHSDQIIDADYIIVND